MPELINDDSERDLRPGDVLMVSRKMRDKRTNKPFDWKFFMVVSWSIDRFDDEIFGYVVGTMNENLKDKPLRLNIEDERNTIHYLDQSEWPDGIHAFRMALIMKRKVEID